MSRDVCLGCHVHCPPPLYEGEMVIREGNLLKAPTLAEELPRPLQWIPG